MSFFKRLEMTLRADANGLIDSVEDPGLMLKQHLRDAELAVHDKQARSAQLEVEAKRLEAERQRALADRARLDQDAELAIAQERDDLARYALGLLVPKLRLLERLDARLEAVADERKTLAETLQAQALALDELRARVRAYLAHRDLGSFDAGVEPATREQIEIELLRRKRSREAGAQAPHEAPPLARPEPEAER